MRKKKTATAINYIKACSLDAVIFFKGVRPIEVYAVVGVL